MGSPPSWPSPLSSPQDGGGCLLESWACGGQVGGAGVWPSVAGRPEGTARAVAMAKAIAAHPSGLLTRSSPGGAFRFVRNDDISPSALMDAAHSRTALRCAEHPFVCRANRLRNQRTKGLPTGQRAPGRQFAGGFSRRGTVGSAESAVLDSARRQAETGRVSTEAASRGETGHWLAALSQSQARLASVSTECLPWFQLDRGADAWPVHLFAQKLDGYLTVRAAPPAICGATSRLRGHLLHIPRGPVVPPPPPPPPRSRARLLLTRIRSTVRTVGSVAIPRRVEEFHRTWSGPAKSSAAAA